MDLPVPLSLLKDTIPCPLVLRGRSLVVLQISCFKSSGVVDRKVQRKPRGLSWTRTLYLIPKTGNFFKKWRFLCRPALISPKQRSEFHLNGIHHGRMHLDLGVSIPRLCILSSPLIFGCATARSFSTQHSVTLSTI